MIKRYGLPIGIDKKHTMRKAESNKAFMLGRYAYIVNHDAVPGNSEACTWLRTASFDVVISIAFLTIIFVISQLANPRCCAK